MILNFDLMLFDTIPIQNKFAIEVMEGKKMGLINAQKLNRVDLDEILEGSSVSISTVRADRSTFSAYSSIRWNTTVKQ